MTGGDPEAGIYLDYQATTPVDPRVLDAMVPYFCTRFGNPHSRQHAYGRAASAAVERARARTAAILGAEAREIVFTSGATESNNLAVRGAARFARERRGRDRVIVAATEHKCVLESAAVLDGEGFAVEILPVAPDGLLDPDRLGAVLDDRTALVSVMAVNNEIGVIQPLARIGAMTRAAGVLFHSDVAQAVGRMPLDLHRLGVDLASVSGHKVYGPKGVGALYVRRRPRARLAPLLAGGGQERGLRSGTVPVPLVVGLGEACAIAGAEMATEMPRLAALRDRLLAALRAAVPDLVVNGSMEHRIAGNLNAGIPGIDGEELLLEVGDIAMSTGSACTSAAVEPSYVLRALGRDAEAAHGSVRIGLGRFTTADEIDLAAARIAAAAARLRGAGA